MKKRRTWAAAIAVATAVLVLCALDSRLRIARYEIEAAQVTERVRIAFIADLHSCAYGEGQQELIDAVRAQAPDLVLFGGDIFEEDMPHENGMAVVRALAGAYPCCFVTGNHEFWSWDATWLKEQLRQMGAVVLEGDCMPIDDTPLQIIGVDDPTGSGAGAVYESGMREQLDSGFAQAASDKYTILLAHRPEYVQDYVRCGADLVLAGHAHGGQMRLPGLINGLWAPNQGWLPEYAGGMYELGGGKMIVSRGLARETTRLPRIFNRPELVIVDIC